MNVAKYEFKAGSRPWGVGIGQQPRKAFLLPSSVVMHVRMHNHNASTVVHCPPAHSSLVSHEHFPASHRNACFSFFTTQTHREKVRESYC